MRTQCELLGVSRSSLDYVPVAEAAENVQIKRLLDEIYLRDPCLGSRRLVTVLERDHGLAVNRKRLQRLRREMGIGKDARHFVEYCHISISFSAS
ncbi:MAG: transposase [Verrucomicrobia bacterium]|nr:transposase [Verrucomicrobiota bacterium]